jgi:hypothetical protein
MFIRFIEKTINRLLNVETTELLDAATCFYGWQQVATNGDEAVV